MCKQLQFIILFFLCGWFFQPAYSSVLHNTSFDFTAGTYYQLPKPQVEPPKEMALQKFINKFREKRDKRLVDKIADRLYRKDSTFFYTLVDSLYSFIISNNATSIK